jgi:hypothetical protein
MRTGRRKKRRSAKAAAGAIRDDRETLAMTEDTLTDFTIDELREFLEADLLDVAVDPEFKERLRRQLWELVQEHARRPPRGEPH